MNRAEWIALAVRCEAATKPDREIDATIEAYVGKWSAADLEYVLTDIETNARLERYTASLDDITALIERELPGASWRLHKVPTASPTRATAEILLHYERRFHADATTPALALLGAFCRAMAERAAP